MFAWSKKFLVVFFTGRPFTAPISRADLSAPPLFLSWLIRSETVRGAAVQPPSKFPHSEDGITAGHHPLDFYQLLRLLPVVADVFQLSFRDTLESR